MPEWIPPQEWRAKRSNRLIKRREQAARALAMRADGKTVLEAAIELGVSPSTVSKLVQDTLAMLPVEHADALRATEGSRLDWLWARARRNVEESEAGVQRAAAIGSAIRVCERKAALFGLDAPARSVLKAEHSHKHTLEPTPEATAALVAAEIRGNPAFAAALAAETARLDAKEADLRALVAPEAPDPGIDAPLAPTSG